MLFILWCLNNLFSLIRHFVMAKFTKWLILVLNVICICLDKIVQNLISVDQTFNISAFLIFTSGLELTVCPSNYHDFSCTLCAHHVTTNLLHFQAIAALRRMSRIFSKSLCTASEMRVVGAFRLVNIHKAFLCNHRHEQLITLVQTCIWELMTFCCGEFTSPASHLH